MASQAAAREFNLEKRRVQRDKVSYRTIATAGDEPPFTIELLNISACGMMAEAKPDLEVGSEIIIDLPIVGKCRGQILWAISGRFGCRFPTVIGLEKYLRMLTAIIESSSRR